MGPSIYIDATHYRAEHSTGVENYVKELLPPLSRMLLEKGWQVAWIGNAAAQPEGLPAGVRWIVSPHRFGWGQTGLLSLLRAHRPDLYFTPSGIPPVLYRGETAVTVHDLAAYVYPQAFTPGQLLRLRPLMRLASRRASLILAPSRFTCEEIVRLWKIPASRIALTPLAYREEPVASEPVDGVDPKAETILFVGRIERKKNLLPLIGGFGQLAAEHPLQLVLAGKEGFGADEVRAAVSQLPEEQARRVVLAGYVSDGQKRWLYEKSSVVAVPGMAEGASLPLLEAFAHGVPAVCAQAGPLPEIGGEACLYVQGDIATDWRLQLKSALEDASWREKAAEAGRKRLKSFSWQESAETAAEAMEKLVEGGGR